MSRPCRIIFRPVSSSIASVTASFSSDICSVFPDTPYFSVAASLSVVEMPTRPSTSKS